MSRSSKSQTDGFLKNVQFSGAIASILSLPISIVGTLIAGFILRLFNINIFTADSLFNFVVALLIFSLFSLSISMMFLHRTSVTKDEIKNEARELEIIRRDLDRQDQFLGMIEAVQHEASDNQRRVALRVRAMISDDVDKKEIENRIISNWRKFSQLYVDNCREIFQILTGENCATCVKVLGWPLGDGREPTVETLIRDNVSKRHRNFIDQVNSVYSASSNTAFNQITHDTSFESAFVCNDLVASETYLNINERWKRFYNSTLVCRIGGEHFSINEKGHDKSSYYDLVGFLCIDSQKAKFDTVRCMHVGRLLSKIYNEYLNYISRLFFHLWETGQLSELTALKEDGVDMLSSVEAFMQGVEDKPRSNRPIGLKIRRVYDEEGRESGVHLEKTAMIIHCLYRQWRNTSLA